jgi:hypothetical protein
MRDHKASRVLTEIEAEIVCYGRELVRNRFESVKRCIAPKIDRGNVEAPVPGFLTQKAAEERLTHAIIAAKGFDPVPALLAEFQVTAKLGWFALTVNGNPIEATKRYKTAAQGMDNALADNCSLSMLTLQLQQNPSG